MKTAPTMLVALVAAVPMLLGAAVPPAVAAEDGACLNEPQIEAAISSGEIKSWAKIRQLAGIPKAYREASDVQVCLQGGVPYFKVSMVSPKGEYFKIVLNAVDGSS